MNILCGYPPLDGKFGIVLGVFRMVVAIHALRGIEDDVVWLVLQGFIHRHDRVITFAVHNGASDTLFYRQITAHIYFFNFLP
jgi:hypothetical protein